MATSMINKNVPLSQPTDTYRLVCTDVCAVCGVFIQDLSSHNVSDDRLCLAVSQSLRATQAICLA